MKIFRSVSFSSNNAKFKNKIALQIIGYNENVVVQWVMSMNARKLSFE